MTQVRNASNLGVAAKTVTTGVVVPVNAAGFVPLTATTFYFPVGDADSTQQSVHVVCDALIAGTFTLELSDLPLPTNYATDVPDTTDFQTTNGTWLTWNPAAAVVPAAAGSTPTAATVAVVATAGGTGFMWLIPDMGAKRMRVKAVVTTPGSCRVTHHGKY